MHSDAIISVKDVEQQDRILEEKLNFNDRGHPPSWPIALISIPQSQI
jgi:hypothetical protein